MDRIRVVGCSGSGKTTTAGAIAARLGIPHLELDAIHWLPGWTERDAAEFRRIVLEYAQKPRWVIDGNYAGRLERSLDDLADTHVWLDLPRWRVTSAVLARTLRRAFTREQLWGTGNKERITSLFRREPADNIVLWAWTQHAKYHSRYEAEIERGDHGWIRLRSRREINQFLDHLSP